MTGDFELCEEIKAMSKLADDIIDVDGVEGYDNPSKLKAGQTLAIANAIAAFIRLIESNIKYAARREDMLSSLRSAIRSIEMPNESA